MFATPEQLAVDDEAGDAEYAVGFSGTAYGGDFFAQRGRGCEGGTVGAGFVQDGGKGRDILDVEFAFPEALEDCIVVSSEYPGAGATGVQHAGGGERRIPDLLWAADDQAAFARLAAAIHVAVADAAPLMGVAAFLQHGAVSGDACRTEIGWNVQHIRQPFDAHLQVSFQLVGRVLRQIRVWTFVVRVDR